MGPWVLMSLLWTGLTQNRAGAGSAAPAGAARWEQTALARLETVLCRFICDLRAGEGVAPLQLGILFWVYEFVLTTVPWAGGYDPVCCLKAALI